MQHSNFIFISVLALCKHAVSTESGSGNLPDIIQKVPELPPSQNATVGMPAEKNGVSSPKNSDITELKQKTTETTTDLNHNDLEDKSTKPFPKTKMSDASKQNIVNAINKFKLKLKMTNTKTELKEKPESAKKKNSPKHLGKNDEMIGDNKNKTKLYMLYARNSKELKDNMKREQLLEWLYNARPLLENETKLWANVKTEKNIKPGGDFKEKAKTQTEKDGSKSDNVQKIEAEFQTIEEESKEKLTSATKKREYTKKTGAAASQSDHSTTKTAVVATNDIGDSDSSSGDGLRLESAKSKEVVKKVKITAKTEPDTEMTSEETIENVTEKNTDKQKEKSKTIQRFAPNDGPSSSESASVS